MTTIMPDRRTSTTLTEVGDKWGRFVALGAGLLIAGCVASINFFATTLVSILYIAAVMFAGGLMQLAHAIANRGWKKRLLGVVSGLFFGKRLADHARLEVPRHQSVDILRGPSVGHAN